MNKTVLIAEDYRDAREMMKYLLEFYGYDVLEACDGDEAVRNAHQFHPDLILMDLMMPRMDGLTATRLIRQDETLAGIPIIALTALGNAADEAAMASGCNEVVAKPMDFNRLEPLLSHYLD
ncbi:MAG TPA: response regulator [Pyrinomonadaceae bacterium]|nr:response regulator [Pyrinomonadaceae bacterium]